MKLTLSALCLALALALPLLAPAAEVPETFRPDPLTVQRYGPAYRYPQAGWIVLHIEGSPYERGAQQGHLLAPEIAAHLRCFAAVQSPEAPEANWKHTRTLVNALFLRRFHAEFLEEMKGIADGAAAAGAKFNNRPLDLLDIVALNCWAEVEALDSALEALPTGLEGRRFPRAQPKAMPAPKPTHCSAFAATGPATADGKIVFGHITMFGLYPANFYNVWLDLKPTKGHRVLMQTYPGGIQSGMDYYLNDAGLIVCETTINQTRFDITGLSVASRIRQALQYASTIDDAVATLRKENNGLYSNEWLLADVKTNEIAMFELGTHKSKLWRSGKNEWFGDTPGFYWGCNNAKDLDVRLETVPGATGRPENLVWRPSARDKAWQRLYAEHKGKIDAGFARKAFTTAPLASSHSLDAKYTTTALAKDLKSWALFGPPLGRTWQPTAAERKKYPEVRPLVSNPWTVLQVPTPPAAATGKAPTDLAAPGNGAPAPADDESTVTPEPAWRGTLLPQADADIWLAAAFADYERYVAREKLLRGRRRAESGKAELTKADRDRLAVALNAHRSGYQAAARTVGDVPLAKVRQVFGRDEWYRIAAGKGVLLLHELRQLLGDPLFENTMDAFGRAHAGKAVSTTDFRRHCEAAAPGKPVSKLFDSWLNEPGLPVLSFEKVSQTALNRGDVIQGEIRFAGPMRAGSVEVTLVTIAETVRQRVLLASSPAVFQLETLNRPLRLEGDQSDDAVPSGGGVFSVRSFRTELSETLIVYGTRDEAVANRAAAAALQRGLIESGPNITVTVKADSEITDADVKAHHLLLIGRPDSNRLVERFRDRLPVTFGTRSFEVRAEPFAHTDSAVLAAAENPLNPRYSLVVIAGLSAEATYRAAPQLVQDDLGAAEVVVLPHAQPPRELVLPEKALLYNFTE